MIKKLVKLTKNHYVFSIVTKVLTIVIGFVYAIIISRYLGSELKGKLTYINSITAITMIVFSLGIHQAYPYYKKNQYPDIDAKFTRISGMMFLVYTVISCLISCVVMKFDIRITIAVLLTPLYTFTKLITYQAMVLFPNKKNAWELICEVIEIIVLLLVYIFVPRSLIICIGIICLKKIVSIIYYISQFNVKIKPTADDIKLSKLFVIFGIVPMISLLMNNLNYRIDVLMLGNAVSDSEVGVYSVGIQLAEKVWFVSDALRDVLYSKLVNGKGVSEVNKVIRICISISLIIVIGMVLVGKPFIVIAFGTEYADSYYPLLIILFGALSMVYYKIIQAYNIINHKQMYNFVFLSISVLINIIVNRIMIPLYGINGAAFASLISYTVCAVLFVIEYKISTGTAFRDLLLINRDDISLLKGLVSK